MIILRLLYLTCLLMLSFTLVSAQNNSLTQLAGEKEKPMNLNDIRKVLVFRSNITSNIADINEQLINEIRHRKVNFLLDSEEEARLKTAGGSDLLVKVIRENLPEDVKVRIILYKKFVDNYDKKTVEQIEEAVEAAKEYIKRFGDDKEDGELVDYFKKTLPFLESIVKSKNKPFYRKIIISRI